MRAKTFRIGKLTGLMTTAVLVLCAFGLPQAPVVLADNTDYGTCQVLHFPVAPSSGAPVDQTVVANYCTPTAWASGPHAIDILTHGTS